MYISVTQNNQLIIYDDSYNKIKTINVPVPSDYSIYHSYDNYERFYTVSKHIFNTDDKLEFVIRAQKNNHLKFMIINEDGDLIKDFTSPEVSSFYYPEVYHDPIQNKNKLRITQTNLQSKETYDEIYLLPTNSLSNKEINQFENLSFFPNPTNDFLYIDRPGNSTGNLIVVNASGRVVYSEILQNKDILKIDVRSFPKGVYFVKVGNKTSKFIKK